MNGRTVLLGVSCALVLAMAGCSRQQSDWQKARETNTTDSYEQFLKKYPAGEFTTQAQARARELYEERDWQKARDLDTSEAYQAFLKQYPEGKWTEEARIRVENFALAQAPWGAAAPAPGAPDPSAATRAPAAGSSAAHGGPPPAANRAAIPAPAPQPNRGAAGAYAVQLGAFKSGAEAAHERWARLQKAYPSVLAGLSSKVLPKRTASGRLYRLQATGLTLKHARAICGRLAAKAEACIVVAPTRS